MSAPVGIEPVSSLRLWVQLGTVWQWVFRVWLGFAVLTVFTAVRAAHSGTLAFTPKQLRYLPPETPLARIEYELAQVLGLEMGDLYFWWPLLLLAVLFWGLLLGIQALEVSTSRSPGTSVMWRKIMWCYQIVGVVFTLLMIRGSFFYLGKVDPSCVEWDYGICGRVPAWGFDRVMSSFLGAPATELYQMALFSVFLLVVSLMGINISYRSRALMAALVIPVGMVLAMIALWLYKP